MVPRTIGDGRRRYSPVTAEHYPQIPERGVTGHLERLMLVAMDSPLHRYARKNDGVVTVAAARDLGYDWSRLRTIIRDEGWTRIAPSAYAVPSGIDLRGRVRAEQLRHGGDLVASHRTAVALHGGDVLVPGFDFTHYGTARFDVQDGVLYRWKFDANDVAEVGGLRVTSAARTATDVLRALPRHEAIIAVDSLLRCGAVTLDVIASRLERLAARRYVRSRAWPAFARLDPLAGSVAESKARLVLYDAGLHPRSQVTLVDVTGRRIRVDFWFAHGVAIEIEGFAFHASRDHHQADIARFNELTRVPGVTVLRFSWSDIFHRPRAMVAATRAVLARSTEVTGESRHEAVRNW